MSGDFLLFQKFQNIEQANSLTELLKNNNIEFLLEDTKPSFDPSFANNEIAKEYVVKVRKEDLEKADKLLERISQEQLSNVESDHFLYDFSDEELIDVVKKLDEWGHFNHSLAQKILKERGKEVNLDEIGKFKEVRIKELSQPEKSQKLLVAGGYLLAILGGLLGVLIGWQLASAKKTLPNGERVYAYSLDDRKHGNRIFLLSIGFVVFWIVIRIISNESN